MRFTAVALLLAATGFAAAQTATVATSAATATTSSTCAAQNILDACLTSTKVQLDACAGNDYGCLCDQYTNVLTCYNNCPADPGRFGVQQEQLQNCNAAKAYGSTSLVASGPTATTTAASSGTAASGTKTTAVASGFASASGSGTATGSAKTTSSSKGAAAGLAVAKTGGFLGIVAAAFSVLL